MKRSHSLFLLFLIVSCLGTISFSQSSTHKTRGEIQTDRPALTRELTAQVIASRRAPDPISQRWLVAQPGVKIAVKQAGMYRVSRVELESAGFPVDSDSANWRLFVDGHEQAIIVGEGGQYVDFYGRGIDTFETDTRVYYLISDTAAGRRMESKTLRPIGGNVVSANYRFIVEKKERLNYDSRIQNGEAENFFGRAVISDPAITPTIALTNVDPQGPDATLQVNIQGLIYGQHNVRVVFNGSSMGVITGSDLNRFTGTFVVPQTLLREGSNSLVLNSVASSDVSYFDSATINYTRHYGADQNRLSFHTPGYRKVDLTGFASLNIRVFDTTHDGDPQLISNPAIVQNGGTFTASLPSDRPAVFYAVEDSGLLHSPSVTFDQPSTLASPDNAAEMIIISASAPEMLAAAETWANYRRTQAGGGFTVKVVDIADVYDEFSYGLHKAQAIKDFLAFARQSWQTPAPAYVMLLGDASYDRRNYLGYGYWDLVPAQNVSFTYEEGASDDALADLDDDGVIDLAIGRIPARNGSAAYAVLSKTIAFESPANQVLTRGALFAYDMPLGFNFEEESQIFRSQLPRWVPSQFISRADQTAHQQLIDGINAGPYIVNFSGHGAAWGWASQSFFTVNDVPLLTNFANPTIFTSLPDYTNLFNRPESVSLGESLLLAPNGGGAAVFAGITITTPDNQLAIGTEFYRLLGRGEVPRLGDIVKASKLPAAGTNLGYAFVLLGDPAMKAR